ncbi:MAG: hypothetical protein ACOZAN_03295 [Patescibacteria group bacterium]
MTKIETALQDLNRKNDEKIFDLVDYVDEKVFASNAIEKKSNELTYECLIYYLSTIHIKVKKTVDKIIRYHFSRTNRKRIDVEELLNSDPISFPKKVYSYIYGKSMPKDVSEKVMQSMFYREYHPQVFLIKSLLSAENLGKKNGVVKLSSFTHYFFGWLQRKIFRGTKKSNVLVNSK